MRRRLTQVIAAVCLMMVTGVVSVGAAATPAWANKWRGVPSAGAPVR